MGKFHFYAVALAVVIGNHAPAASAADYTAKCYAKCNKILNSTMASFDKCVLKPSDEALACLAKAGVKQSGKWAKVGTCSVDSSCGSSTARTSYATATCSIRFSNMTTPPGMFGTDPGTSEDIANNLTIAMSICFPTFAP